MKDQKLGGSKTLVIFVPPRKIGVSQQNKEN